MMLGIENSSFAYRRSVPVLADINLELGGGHLLAILGPNGVGKTTLLRCMLGLLTWTRGRTTIDGRDIREFTAKEHWRRIAYVPQARNAGALSLLGRDMVTIGRSTHRHVLAQPGAKDHAIAQQVMDEIGIGHLADTPCGEMSGGQFQMVLIARALAGEPHMLVLDEPETGLDFRNQLIVLNLLARLATERGLLVVMNTHYPAHALQVADHAMLLGRDQASWFGPVDRIVTAENLRHAFGVDVHLCDIEVDGQVHHNVLPLRVADSPAAAADGVSRVGDPADRGLSDGPDDAGPDDAGPDDAGPDDAGSLCDGPGRTGTGAGRRPRLLVRTSSDRSSSQVGPSFRQATVQ